MSFGAYEVVCYQFQTVGSYSNLVLIKPNFGPGHCSIRGDMMLNGTKMKILGYQPEAPLTELVQYTH